MNRIHRDPRTGHVTVVSDEPAATVEAPEGWEVVTDGGGDPVPADVEVDESGDDDSTD